MPFPDSDFAFTAATIRALIDEATPGWRTTEPSFLGRGYDVEVWRLGPDVAVRVPRRRVAFDLVAKEIAWLPRVPHDLALAVPHVLASSLGSGLFPGPYFVTQLLDGTTAQHLSLAQVATSAGALGATLAGIHQLDSSGMPFNSVRGVPLRERLVYFEREVVDLPAPLVAVARRYVAVAVDEPVDRDLVFMHGDVHRANLMQIDGSLTSLIDFGDLGYGDRAGDLGGAIFSVGVDGVADLLAGYGPVSTSTLVKAFGWACYFAVRNYGVGDRTAETAVEFLTTLAAHGH